MKRPRVAVTGLGVISSLGPDCASFWSALGAGRCGFRPIEAVDRTRLCSRIGAEVREIDPSRLAAIAGGSDAPFRLAHVKAWEAMRERETRQILGEIAGFGMNSGHFPGARAGVRSRGGSEPGSSGGRARALKFLCAGGLDAVLAFRRAA